MTIRNLLMGPNVRRVAVVWGYTRLIVVMSALGMLSGDAALAQRSLASVLLPSDTTGVRKTKVASSGFLRGQMANDRVFAARVEKRFELKKMFRDRGIAWPAEEIFFRSFKRERVLELWVRPVGQETFVLLKSYEVCALTGKPGPKRRQGDLQTPEGFYHIENFNPQSDYHLSMRVNYPNLSDRILGIGSLGGDIYIHGSCKSAGCLAVNDENIKEIYWLAVEARDHGQRRIPVHIFPTRLTAGSLQQLIRIYEKEPELGAFWTSLKPGYDFFEQNHTLPVVSVSKRGAYRYAHIHGDDLLGQPTADGAAQN
jgi:murein L,D-transpeptidase YafK